MQLTLQFVKIAGACLAFVLGMGIISKFDKTPAVDGLQLATIAPSEDAPTSNTSLEMPAINTTTRYVEPERQRQKAALAMPSRSEAKPVRTSNRSSLDLRDFEEWVDRNAAQAYLEADQETIAPGVILATGIYFLQEGQGDMSMSAADVASYLTTLRENAPKNAKRQMKYIANSAKWFEGLTEAGFDGKRLAHIFGQFSLRKHDKHMFSRHVEKNAEETDYSGQVSRLADNTAARSSSLAEAYNDYADREDVRSKHSLPAVAAPARPSRNEISAGRREAESFTSGESRTYDDPREFWAVLKEMIALENSYPSWEAYQAENGKRAKRNFQRRSNIMSLGGVMKVTRKDGA